MPSEFDTLGKEFRRIAPIELWSGYTPLYSRKAESPKEGRNRDEPHPGFGWDAKI